MERLSVEASPRLSEKDRAIGKLERRWNQEVEENNKSQALKEEEVRQARQLAASRLAEAAAAKRAAEAALQHGERERKLARKMQEEIENLRI
eukprot:12881334-Prorocentrum_lima.AAC.1